MLSGRIVQAVGAGVLMPMVMSVLMLTFPIERRGFAMGLFGIVMAFGKFFLLPLVGHTVFGALTFVLKNVHNFAGPLFAVSLLVVIRKPW